MKFVKSIKTFILFIVIFLIVLSLSLSMKAVENKEKEQSEVSGLAKLKKTSLKKLQEKKPTNHLPCLAGCNCNPANNRRPIPPGARPIEPQSYAVKTLSTFPNVFTLGWDQKLISDLDIRLKSINGVDFPKDYYHRIEFNNQVTRTEANGIKSQSDEAESLTIKGTLPKGEYLLYVYNCANNNPLVDSKALLKLKSGPNKQEIFSVTIPSDKSAINYRIWRIGIIESSGAGNMKFKVINRVSRSVDVKFDGKIQENRVVNNVNNNNKNSHLPCHGGCSCNPNNNKRPIPPGAKPIEPQSYTVKTLSSFPTLFTLDWDQKLITDLDIHLKSTNGVDFPKDYYHRNEFNNQVTRTEANGIKAQSNGAESLTIKGILPKGEYLLYVYNCANTNPLVDSKALLKLKSGPNKQEIFNLSIPSDQSAINSRVWRIGIIESTGMGTMKFKVINRVSTSVDVKFDGKIQENRIVNNVKKNNNNNNNNKNSHLPCHGGCSCNPTNNKRPVPPGAKPIEPQSYTVKTLSSFPNVFTLDWNQNLIKDLDIHLRSTSGVDFPKDYYHRVEFNNQVSRTEANGIKAQSNGAESLTIKGILPKGEYLLYVYNCENKNPLVDSKALLKLKSGPNKQEIFNLSIPSDQSAINSRVWRIGIIESTGTGTMKFKVINRVSTSVDVKFDGKIQENRIVNNVKKNNNNNNNNKNSHLPCHGGCSCNPTNNKRPVPPGAKPIEPKISAEVNLSDFPTQFTLDWNQNQIKDLDIHLKSTNGVDFPKDYYHRVAFNNQVSRTEANGIKAQSNGAESLTIKGTLPKGEYLVYVYNCENKNPLVDSKAILKLKTGPSKQEVFSISIPVDLSAVNSRVWRIGIIESTGTGAMKFKVINRVSSSVDVKFDGKALTAKPEKCDCQCQM